MSGITRNGLVIILGSQVAKQVQNGTLDEGKDVDGSERVRLKTRIDSTRIDSTRIGWDHSLMRTIDICCGYLQYPEAISFADRSTITSAM